MKQKIRNYKRYASLLVVIGLLIVTGLTRATMTYPKPTTSKYLNDYAEVVDSSYKQEIIKLGNELEEKTGAQAIVVTLDTLQNIPIEEYANGLFREWGIGQANKDNGLLIVLVIKDKQWRVEVGRGLEGAIPDVLTNRIMVELGKNYFEQEDYGQGLASVYSQFCDEIAKEYNVSLTYSLHTNLPTSQNTQVANHKSFIPYLWIIAFSIFDLIFNRGRILSFLIQILYWNTLLGGGRRNGGNRGGGSGGGFGGGSSNGGGSSGKW